MGTFYPIPIPLKHSKRFRYLSNKPREGSLQPPQRRSILEEQPSVTTSSGEGSDTRDSGGSGIETVQSIELICHCEKRKKRNIDKAASSTKFILHFQLYFSVMRTY